MSMRGVPWDDAPGAKIWPSKWIPDNNDNTNNNDSNDNNTNNSNSTNLNNNSINELSKTDILMKHAEAYARRFAFGASVGALTGMAFGGVEILKDINMMMAARQKAAKKLRNYTGMFGSFFASYQVMHHTMSTYTDLPPIMAVAAAGSTCIAPLIFSGRYRGMIPYGIVLVGLDAINLYQEGMLG